MPRGNQRDTLSTMVLQPGCSTQAQQGRGHRHNPQGYPQIQKGGCWNEPDL